MKYDLNILQEYIDKGLIECQKHPTLPLKIYNYSRNCAYERKWDDITKNCRGLILDDEGTVIAKSFQKFFNFEELSVSDFPFTDDYVWLSNKEDGSLGILFYYDDKWILSSKGSFTSDQAIKGKEILEKYNTDYLRQGYTYLFEIIYPENRIVVNYGKDEKLILLGVFDDKNREVDSAIVNMAATVLGCESPKIEKVTLKSYDDILNLSKEIRKRYNGNSEGFVLRFIPSNFRIKVKFEEYVRLHALVTQFSNVDIWETLKKGENFDQYLERVPDEFDKFVNTVLTELKSQYSEIEQEARKNYIRLRTQGLKDKKDKVFWAQKHVDKKYHSIIYNMIDRRDYSQIIYKMIKPKFIRPTWGKNNE